MMAHELKLVFSFTLGRQLAQPGFRRLTAAVALLCFLIPAAVLGLMAADASGSEPEPEVPVQQPVCQAESVAVTDETADGLTDWQFLAQLHPTDWPAITYVDPAQADSHTLLVTFTQEDSGLAAHISLTEDSALTEEDVVAYESFLYEVSPAILQVKAGITAQQLAVLMTPVTVTQQDSNAMIRQVLGMILPYLGIMVMYFLVLFYGQGVANSVLLEKTSKLMDFFLVSVRPTALVLGKTLALALAGLGQLAVWVVSLAAGFAAGAGLCRTMAPDADFAILQFFDSLSVLQGVFSLPSILLAVGVLLAGFLMYCALSAIGGALAGKSEDLASTNVFFSLILVASFLSCLLLGVLDGGEAAPLWMYLVPFTAILVTPAAVLLDTVPLYLGGISLVLVTLTAVVLCAVAGKVYTAMSLYKGNPPKPRELLQLLRS